MCSHVPGSLTRIMARIVRPRKASRERSRGAGPAEFGVGMAWFELSGENSGMVLSVYRSLAMPSERAVRCTAAVDEQIRISRGKVMAAKTVNVGLIGQKFMGKAHSNAYLKVGKFFDCDPQPVMKTIC